MGRRLMRNSRSHPRLRLRGNISLSPETDGGSDGAARVGEDCETYPIFPLRL